MKGDRLEVIKNNGNIIAYVNDAKEYQKYLPQEDILISHKIYDDKSRKLIYKDSGVYKINPSDKDFGIYAGDICQVCRKGTLVDYGGCATCPDCGAQLKCGL